MPEPFLFNKQYMITCTAFVWFFSFVSTSYVVPVVPYNARKINKSFKRISKVKSKTLRMEESKNVPYFCLWIKWYWRANSMKETSSMSKNRSNLCKSCFYCYFHRSLVNFKNLIICFWNIRVMDSSFAVPNYLIRSLFPRRWKTWKKIGLSFSDSVRWMV